MSGDAAAVRAGLVTALAPVLGPVEIDGLARLKGGYSRQMWSFDARPSGHPVRPLILCIDSATGVVGRAQSVDRMAEARLLHTLHERGVAVPDALCAGGPSGPFGRAFLVMTRGAGTTAVGPLQRDPWYVARRGELGHQLATMLAAIHAVDLPDDVLPDQPAPATVAAGEVARWSSEMQATPEACTPAVARALVWLDCNRPVPPPVVTLVHGDYRTGNILHGRPQGFHTVLDWEMAHRGDPLEDVAWAQLVCWRVGTGRVGGLVELDEWHRTYAAAAGRPVDQEALRFWEVLGTVKMTALIWRAAAVVDADDERSLLLRLAEELAAELEDRLLPA